jgi:diguanylate cyclase (GGDEF)-like protein/PAS domain S-box-containing protein
VGEGGSAPRPGGLQRLLPLSADGLRDFGAPEAAGQLSAVLFFLCGLLVAFTAPLVDGPNVHQLTLIAVGLTAAASGVVIMALPWHRWPRRSTLVLVPLAFALIALHNWATGGDGFRYSAFFLVVAAWVGLMHPRWTTLACTPLMVLAYLLPSIWLGNFDTVFDALTYALPVFILVGESASLVADRVRISERDLRSSEQRFRALVQNSADAISVIAADATILWDSPGITAVLGYDPEERVGTDGFDYLHPDDLADVHGILAELLAQPGSTKWVELRIRHRDGSYRHCQIAARNLTDEPAVGGLVINISDITQQHEAAQALANSEESFRLLFSANPQPMWVYDAETLRFVEVNDAAVAHYGYTREQFLAMTIADIRPAEEFQRLLRASTMSNVVRHSDNWRHFLADGREIEVEITSHRLQFAGREAVLVAVQDVTERNILESQLRHQAFHDSLTGLSNRALFTDRVEHALGRRTVTNGPIVLLLDLDRFKLVNDSLGHHVGDDLLVAAARRLQESLRASDTVARLGGDEFAILLDQCSPARAQEQATRLLDAISRPMDLNGKQVVATGSIGIAAADTASSGGELLRNADMAMYRAKAAGGGCFRVFEQTMHSDAVRHLEVNANLREAIENERFVLHYQPVIDANSGQAVAMEALARWRRDGELVSPAEFIPALEESGLILELGEWILRRACLDAAMWPAHLQVNVNLSGRQLADPTIVQHVQSALEESGLEPSRLMLEITESVIMHNTETSVRRLVELRELGVGFAIDDFGTGYSSLSYLRSFPVNELKIDRSFIETIADDPASVPLVATIVQLARALNLTTVAEGVETEAQFDLLKKLGCDRVQGYFFARPAPVEIALALAS